MARKKDDPKPSRATQSAGQVDYATWKASAAAALEREHNSNPDAIPPRLWRHFYIQNLSPEQAAEQASVTAYNIRPAFSRKR
jgi:hypothetical protein